MSEMVERKTARIYQFPMRNTARGTVSRTGQGNVAELATARLPTIEFGSNWYHEEAIREAETARKR